ncbi:MAG: tetratricopeptide repeat protein [Polyangiaceae bacterium]|jgi:tetratricopeptide (TPR) repeat protein
MKLGKSARVLGFVGTALLAVGCGGGGGAKEAETPVDKTPAKAGPAPLVAKEAQDKFNAALDAFNDHDKKSDWSDATCADVAQQFAGAASQQKGGSFSEATYDAGLAYQRCGDDKDAKAQFEKALQNDPKFHYARAELALYQYKADGNEDGAIIALQQAVLDAQFQNVPALVNLAMFQMLRDSDTAGNGCKNDMECAKTNLQRALALDDAYMPALNQLAMYYFQEAKKRAGEAKASHRGRHMSTNAAMGKRADVQQLDLAALVCSQAVRKNPSYAPIHNTAGLIQNELGQVNGAVAEFGTASKLDPKFFEAQMNYAAVNLSFRGFEQAQGAYKKALEMHPNDYDGHLGLALALRGQINDSNYDTQVAAVQAELDTCKKLDPNRPDVFYNEGILTQEYKAKSGGDKDKTIASLTQAKTIFQSFVDKAQGKDEYNGAVKRATERMKDIDDTIAFLQLPGGNTPPPPAATPAAPDAAAPAPAAGATPAPAPGAAPASPAPAPAAAPAPAGSATPAPAPAGGN